MSNVISEQNDVYNVVASLSKTKKITITDATPLIGDAGIFDSMKLVELCLALEDRAEEMGFEFDWTSDVAMSKSKSMFRSVGSLTEEFNRQQAEQR